MPEWVTNTPWWAVVGLTVTIGYAVIKFARWTSRVDNRLDTLTETIRDGLAEVRADIKKILERPANRVAVEGQSPVQLTDFGREISATGQANEWARTHAPKLVADAKGKEEFELFDLCVAYIEGRFKDDPDFARTVRATAYQHGTDAEQVLKVYQVELRDRLLMPDS